MSKFASRKFLICVAAFLGSIGASIAALHSDNQIVASVGIVCAIFSAAIYAAVEAYVDGKAMPAAERFFELDEYEDFDDDDEDLDYEEEAEVE